MRAYRPCARSQPSPVLLVKRILWLRGGGGVPRSRSTGDHFGGVFLESGLPRGPGKAFLAHRGPEPILGKYEINDRDLSHQPPRRKFKYPLKGKASPAKGSRDLSDGNHGFLSWRILGYLPAWRALTAQAKDSHTGCKEHQPRHPQEQRSVRRNTARRWRRRDSIKYAHHPITLSEFPRPKATASRYIITG